MTETARAGIVVTAVNAAIGGTAMRVTGVVRSHQRIGRGHVQITVVAGAAAIDCEVSADRCPPDGRYVVVSGLPTVHPTTLKLRLTRCTVTTAEAPKATSPAGPVERNERPFLPTLATVRLVCPSYGTDGRRDFTTAVKAAIPAVGWDVAAVPMNSAGDAAGIARAIRATRPDASVVAIVRGGGPSHTLDAFNARVVADAIAKCPIPVITGIGHTDDHTLAGRAATVDAPTPTAAARVITDRYRPVPATAALPDRHDVDPPVRAGRKRFKR